MEQQKLSKQISLPPQSNLSNLALKFLRDLSTELSIHNRSLRKCISEDSKQIKALRLKKSQLFLAQCNMNKNRLQSNEHLYIFQWASSNELWRHSLQFGMQKISEGVVRHNKNFIEWKSAAERQLQVSKDDFTMMPFHQVEMEIKAIDLKISDERKAIQETVEKTDAWNSALEAELKQLLLDIGIMEPYEEEIRKSKRQLNQTLSEIKIKQRLDSFQRHCQVQKTLQIQKDIDELQKQITALQQLQSK